MNPGGQPAGPRRPLAVGCDIFAVLFYNNGKIFVKGGQE
jgi:hypothetical protein